MAISTWLLLRVAPAVVGALTAASATAADVAEICVECSGPSATYRCVVPEASRIAEFRGGDRALGFLCVTEIAKGSGHEKCRARRDASVCVGVEKIVNFSDALTGPPPSGPEAAVQDDPNKDAGSDAPPKTVVELMRRSADASQEQLKKAGDAVKGTGSAVGGAVKKGWHCLTSMFKEC